MAKTLNQVWYDEFRGSDDPKRDLPSTFQYKAHCGLCGNHGVIDTRGKVFTPAGVECGIRAYCICPNGRALKRHKAKL